MPKRSKKKAVVKEPEPAWDFAKVPALDGAAGALGVEHPHVTAAISAARAVRSGGQRAVERLACCLPERHAEATFPPAPDMHRHPQLCRACCYSPQELVSKKIEQLIAEGGHALTVDDLGLAELPASCLDASALQVLRASGNHLVDTVFVKLARLPELRELHLNRNFFMGSLAADVGDCRALRVLSLNDNSLTAIPEALGGCTALEELHIARNRVTELPGEALARMPKLRVLDAAMNLLAELPADIGHCTSLQTLALDSNKLASLPDALGACTELRVLQLRMNAIPALPESLAACRHMQVVDVAHNKLTGFPGSAVSAWGELLELWCEHNKIAALPDDIGHCTQLVVLNAAHNALSSVPDSLARCTELEELYLFVNPKLNAVPAESAAWTAIKELNTRGCRVKTVPPETAEAGTGWTNAVTIDMSSKGKKPSCKVSEEWLDAMQRTRVVGTALAKKKKGKKGKKK